MEGHQNIVCPEKVDRILFDGDCRLCRYLAELLLKKATQACRPLEFQQNPEQHPASIVVETATGERLDGQDAWQWLLENLPELATLRWLAQKLGLEEEASSALWSGSKLLRRLCPRCRHP